MLLNETGKRLYSDAGKLEKLVEIMKLRRNKKNTLAERVEANNWNQKTLPFQKIISNDLLDFPELTIEDLELLFTGSYQLSQAISYLGEMLEDGVLNIGFLKQEPYVFKFEVRYRHIAAQTYKCYVECDPNKTRYDAIKDYCCNCPNGWWTVGCCSHTAALIYYLSHGRYLSKSIRPAEVLTNLFDMDNICPVIDENSDED